MEKNYTYTKHDKRYMKIAQVWSENSYAARLKVGAIIVKDGTMIADGYNGTPKGFSNRCEDICGETFSHVLHAEANAISKLAKSNSSSLGATLYTTHAPCLECAKLIIQAGIVRVVFDKFYRLEDGIDLLEKAKIETIKLNL